MASSKRLREALDRLAAANGLTSLLAFESYSPEDADAAGLLDDEALAQLPPAEWFAPAAGLAAVNALREHLEAHPDVLAAQAAVMEDLDSVGDELEAAGRAGVRFRFAVIM